MTTSAPTITTINKTEARSTGGMVATKDIHATKAGVRMLEMGGNAVDAAVAACFAIGVVEPWSCGIGGGGYMVYQLGDQGGVIGFPMKGPLDATPDMYEFTGEKAPSATSAGPASSTTRILRASDQSRPRGPSPVCARPTCGLASSPCPK